jgi:hypothetical protein
MRIIGFLFSPGFRPGSIERLREAAFPWFILAALQRAIHQHSPFSSDSKPRFLNNKRPLSLTFRLHFACFLPVRRIFHVFLTDRYLFVLLFNFYIRND